MRFNIPYRHRNASGIYAILNLVNAKVYVGSAVCLKRRFDMHLSRLLRQNHHSVRLINAVNKYGLENFSFVLLELCEKDFLIINEQKWFERFNVYIKGYNSAPIAGSQLGIKHSKETREKVSKALSGRIVSEETRTRLSIALKGKKRTQEQRDKMSKSAKGRTISEETRSKMSLSLKGKKLTPEQCKNNSLRQKGKKVSAEARLKMSRSHKLRIRQPLSEETKKKIGDANRGRTPSSETLLKYSLARKGKPSPTPKKPINQYTLDGNFIKTWWGMCSQDTRLL